MAKHSMRKIEAERQLRLINYDDNHDGDSEHYNIVIVTD